MPMWKRNRGAEDGGSAVDTEETGGGVALATRPAAKKRKPHELLTSVVKESTTGAAVALMKENEAFALPNGKSWVVLGLPVEGIGGLSMKQKNDEAKGSIIELITADEITTVATDEMLSGETFGIIPSASSLNRMDEFSLLKNAEYLWTTMEQRPDGTLKADAVSYATYEQALSISAGHTTLAEVLPEVWAWGGGGDAEAGTGTAAAPAASSAPAEADTSAADTGTAGGSDEPFTAAAAAVPEENSPFGVDASDFAEPVDYNALAGDDGGAVDDDGFEGDGDYEPEFDDGGVDAGADAGTDGAADQEPVYAADDRVFEEEEVRAVIARRFLSSELDLEVDLETFETNFSSSAPMITFPVDEEATDWLGRQVNVLARQANAEMEQLHVNNQDSLRELYVSLMSNHVEKVIADVSPDREGSYYNRLMTAAKEDLAGRQKENPATIAVMRRELNERYESEALARGNQAREQAILQFKERNRPRHERELAEIGVTAERAVEESYDGATQTILEMRRRDAMARLDLGKTKILDLLMEHQQERRDAETELLQSWSARLMEFVDENRKEDIARSEALAAQLSRDTQIAELKAEHAAGVEEMRANQRSKVEELNDEIGRIRADAVAELAARDQTWKHQLELKDRDMDQANNRVQELMGQMGQIDKIYEEQYKQQIETLKTDKASAEQALLNNSAMMSGFSKTFIAMIVIMFLAVLAVGFIIGSAVSGSPEPASAAALVSSTGGWLPAF